MKRYLAIVLAASLYPAAALAQPADSPPAEPEATPAKTAPPTSPENLPPSRSDTDVQPPVASPAIPPGGVVSQAGVGGSTGYGRAGVLELGGSAGFRVGSGFSEVSVSPSIGWFLADNLELTSLFDITHVDTGVDSGSIVSALVEPSYHLPFNRSVFGFLGVGLGGAWVQELGAGFAMAPRIGANLMVGRSGILSPSVSWQYTTHDINTNGNVTDPSDEQPDTVVLAVSSALRMNIGYTVMW